MFLSLICAKKIAKISRPSAFEPLVSNSNDICPIRIDDPSITWEWITKLYSSVSKDSIINYNKLWDKQLTVLEGLLPIYIPTRCPDYIEPTLMQSNEAFKGTPIESNGSLILSFCFSNINSMTPAQCLEMFYKLQAKKYIDQYGHANNVDRYDTYMDNIGDVFGYTLYHSVSRTNKYYDNIICRSSAYPYRYIVVMPNEGKVFNPSVSDDSQFKKCFGVIYKDDY